MSATFFPSLHFRNPRTSAVLIATVGAGLITRAVLNPIYGPENLRTNFFLKCTIPAALAVIVHLEIPGGCKALFTYSCVHMEEAWNGVCMKVSNLWNRRGA